MEGGIKHDATLDYVEFHIFPSQNRYEVSVWSSNREENLASGPLEQLLLHSPEVRNLSSKDSNTKFKILPPDSINDACWFTTTTLTRFLHIIGLPDILSIGKEMSQLEETRNFLTSSSDKSEILVAIDLRLTALKEELASVLNQAIGSIYSLKDMSDLGNFALHFGAKDLRESLQKSVGLSLIEDEDSIEEEDQPDAEGSRGLTRSSMPKRSASPMRRIQIGRSGSRRAASLSIKSLNYFPGREKSTPLRDDEEGDSSEEEESQRSIKNNVLRMSVQDKISLFESKQRDQGVINVQKTKTSSNVTVGANKAVLRRWSSEMGERPTQNLPDETLSGPKNISPDGKTETDNNYSKTETCPEKGTSEELGVEVDKFEPGREESYERHPDSIEWSEEKGAELKLMESKPGRHQSVTSDNSKTKNSKEQRGGFYDQYNKKREEKLQKQAAGKRVEKSSTNVSGANRKHQNEPQKTQKNTSQLINSKIMKPSAIKKSTLKSSSLPATRKSWPSTPSPQPATGPASTNFTPTNRKPQSPASRVENLQPRLKTPKATQPDGNKKIKATNEKKHPTSTENRKTTKTKVQTPKEDTNLNLTTKPSFYNKVTKKNSVVPLETKPFLRKGSRIGPVVTKTRVVSQPLETSKTSENLIQGEENKVATRIDIMIINHEMESESETPISLEPKVVIPPIECEQSERRGDLEEQVSEINSEAEEKVEISPNAWMEYEEHDGNEIIPCKESPIKIGISVPRVRHSLSQMLLEKSNESDIGEWGNDSHPPTLVYQKDAPRGLKRLLKFARKTKADSHLTDWSSPEGEDDAEESKATRSFFSLSAFRGNKTNETKLLHR